MTRRDALEEIYRRLRSDTRGEDGLTPQEASARLFALGLTLQEIEAAMRAHGDLPRRR